MTAPSTPLFIRLPKLTYIFVLALAVGVAPIGLYGGYDHPEQARISFLTLVYVVPVLAAFYIARSATIISEAGITVRAIFGQRAVGWDDVRGLSVTGRNVYAVTTSGTMRLPCVRLSDLAAVSAASGGRLPELPEAEPKYAPSGRRR